MSGIKESFLKNTVGKIAVQESGPQTFRCLFCYIFECLSFDDEKHEEDRAAICLRVLFCFVFY